MQSTVAPPAQQSRRTIDSSGRTDPPTVPVKPNKPLEELREEWRQLLRSSLPKPLKDPMDKLMNMIGLQRLKRTMLDLCKSYVADKTRLRGRNYNFVFLGNPGTGKSEAVEIVAAILVGLEIRSSANVYSKKASEMLHEGSTKFISELRAMIPGKAPGPKVWRVGLVVLYHDAQEEKAYKGKITALYKDPKADEQLYDVELEHDSTKMLGIKEASLRPNVPPSIVVVDEAYDLDPARNHDGRAINNELMRVAEDHRESMTIMLAGYPDDMRDKLFAFNDGWSSRVTKISFDDYDEEELGEIWDHICKRNGVTCKPHDDVRRYAVRVACRKKGMKGFGNAREIRKCFDAAKTKMDARSGHCITVEDVGTRDPTKDNPKLDKALEDLRHLVGLDSVKRHIESLVEQAKVYFELEYSAAKAPDPLLLSCAFTGNPGTGKTTLGKIYGRVLQALGLLTEGEVVESKPMDLVDGHVGMTGPKVAGKMKDAEGKVLLIDEAYVMGSHGYGKEALDAMLSCMPTNVNRCVVLLGYSDEIEKMLQHNPGLVRRFPLVKFEDYTEEEFKCIIPTLLVSAGYVTPLSDGLMQAFLEQIRRRKAQEARGFGNMGAVKEMIQSALKKMRLADRSDLIVEDFECGGGGSERNDPMDLISDLEVPEEFTEYIKSLVADVAMARRRNKPLDGIRGRLNCVLQGPPGTGKTTLAKRIGRILHRLELVNSSETIITSAPDLKGAVVGESEKKFREKMERALGGVLVIDEAHQLGFGVYGQDVTKALVQAMTDDRFKNVVVILAGYGEEMTAFLRTDQGLASRFNMKITLSSVSVSTCARECEGRLKAEGFSFEITMTAELGRGFEDLQLREGWANLRDVKTISDYIVTRYNRRVYGLPAEADDDVITLADVSAAFTDLASQRQLKMNVTSPTRIAQLVMTAESAASPCDPQWSVKRTHAPHAQAPQKEPSLPPRPQDRTDQTPLSRGEVVAEGRCLGRDADLETLLLQELKRTEAKDEVEFRREDYRKVIEEQLEKLKEKVRLEREVETMRRLEEEMRTKLALTAEAEERRKAEKEFQRMEVERRQKEAELFKMEQEERKMHAIRTLLNCPMGFGWRQEAGGYRCLGGSHFVSEEELNQYFTAT